MKTILSILLAAVGIASANSGDTTRLDTLAYGRDTCGGSKTCRYSQVKIHSGSGLYIDSSRVSHRADSAKKVSVGALDSVRKAHLADSSYKTQIVQEEYFATVAARDAAYPSGGFLGQVVWLPNPNVPLGRSRLRWNGTIWAPPAGENIICLFGAAGAAVAQVTPGVLTLSQVYKSALIPDYMIPDGIAFGYHWEHSTKNASGVANSIAYVELSGVTPTATDGGTALVGQSLNPSSSNWANDQPHHGQRVGTQFAHAWGLFSQSAGAGQTTQRSTVSGAFVSNGTFLYVMAKPTHVSDQENFMSFRMWAVGNQ